MNICSSAEQGGITSLPVSDYAALQPRRKVSEPASLEKAYSSDILPVRNQYYVTELGSLEPAFSASGRRGDRGRLTDPRPRGGSV